MDAGFGRADGLAADSEVERELRRRLAFYEGFDTIISENIRRSGDLLREAEQQQAAARTAAGRDRDSQRVMLAELATELNELGARLESIASRVQTALLDVEPVAIPASLERVELAVADVVPMEMLVAEALSAVADVVPMEMLVAEALPAVADVVPMEMLAPEVLTAIAAPRWVEEEPVAAAEATVETLLAEALPAVTPVQWVEEEAAAMRPPEVMVAEVQPAADDSLLAAGDTEVIIHGVTDLATAQAIRLRLGGIQSIIGAEPREFGGGMLRLTIRSTEQLGLADLGRALAPMRLTVSDRGPGAVALLLESGGSR